MKNFSHLSSFNKSIRNSVGERAPWLPCIRELKGCRLLTDRPLLVSLKLRTGACLELPEPNELPPVAEISPEVKRLQLSFSC